METGETGGNGMGRKNHRFRVAVTGITTGKLVDMGTKDSMNMGAAMAPAAWNTICQILRISVWVPPIMTASSPEIWDSGAEGASGFYEERGHDITGKHMDCGLEIYDRGEQDVHSGGSGCGCSAVTLCPHSAEADAGRVEPGAVVPTGALLSTVSYNEGQSIPGIAHAVMLERMEVCEKCVIW